MFHDFCNNVLPADAGSTILKIDTQHFELNDSLFRRRKGSDRASFEDPFSLLSLLCLFGSLSRRTGALFGEAKFVAEMWVCCLQAHLGRTEADEFLIFSLFGPTKPAHIGIKLAI